MIYNDYMTAATQFTMGAKGSFTTAGTPKKRGVKPGTKRGPYKKKAKTAPTVTSLQKQVTAIKKEVKQSKQEVREIRRNGVVSEPNLATTGLIHSLCLASEEDDAATAGTPVRIGLKMTMLRAKLKGYVRWNLTNSNPQTVTLMYVLWKKQTASTYPTIADMFDAGDINYSFPVRDTKYDYKILWSQQFNRNLQIPEVPINVDLDLNGIVTKYNGPLSTNVDENGIYLFCDGTQTTGPVVALNELVYYYD